MCQIMNSWRHNKKKLAEDPDRDPALLEVASVLAEDRALTEFEAIKALQAYGISFPATVLTTNDKEAETAVRGLPGPAVMKIVSRDIPHKTDVGGVVTGVTGDTAAATFVRIWNHVRDARPHARLEGILVQEQLSGIEVMIGAIRDAQFGHAVLFGAGGIWAEALADTTFRISPLTQDDTLNMVHGIQAAEILLGGRHQPSVDVEALCTMLERVSRFVEAFPEVAELDLNPVMATPSGATAVDAYLQVKTREQASGGC